MQTSKSIKIIIGLVCVIWIATIVGCFETAVNVPLKNYQPQIAGSDFSAYKGKPVYLMNFENEANDTTMWAYLSPDKKFSYSNDNILQNYFWYAFQNAFSNLGMAVSRMDNPDVMAPAMWVSLTSITDVNFQVKVTVQKKGITVFTQQYAVQEPPPAETERNAAALEARAYNMTSKLIATILKDPGFQKAVTGA